MAQPGEREQGRERLVKSEREPERERVRVFKEHVQHCQVKT